MASYVQISPNFPPVVCGVGDYAAQLASALQDLGAPISTLVANENPISQQGRSLHSACSSLALHDALITTGTKTVIVHFSGYGYAPQGLCHWLVDGLAKWKASSQERRLVTIFHEVYASGPIWRSSFWTAGPQQRIARDLARLSAAAFVSSGGGHDQLRRLAPELRVQLLPVFSNIGEPETPKPLSERAGRAVVFGGRARRRKVYEGMMHEAEAVSQRLAKLGVTEIVDIGPDQIVPKEIAGCPIRSVGQQKAQEVSAALADARIGLIDYPGHVFTKSGIAAAYFAHRLAVVNTSTIGGFPADLRDGQHFVDLTSFVFGDFDAQNIADAGHNWYRPHRLAATAEQFRNLLA